MLRSRFVSLLFGLALFACSDSAGPTAAGTWGGTEASLVLGASGGTLAYQCGAGTIAPGWALTSDGHFSGTGEHFFGGGPVPPQGSPPHPAIYKGEVVGDRLTLRVTLTDLHQDLGPFHLQRNGPAVAELCL
jgi:hypothetical protein